MAKYWREEKKEVAKTKLGASIRRGTYTQKDIDSFVKDVDVNGLDRVTAGKRNNIPKGSLYHVYTMATSAGLVA